MFLNLFCNHLLHCHTGKAPRKQLATKVSLRPVEHVFLYHAILILTNQQRGDRFHGKLRPSRFSRGLQLLDFRALKVPFSIFPVPWTVRSCVLSVAFIPARRAVFSVCLSGTFLHRHFSQDILLFSKMFYLFCKHLL